MDDDLFLINDIENEYKKLSAETKKKYPKIKELIDFALKTMDIIKSTIMSNNNNINTPQAKEKFKNDLKLSMDIIIKPLTVISEGKYYKLNFSSVLILKKLITYNYITDKQYNIIIKILKEMYDNSNEDTQLKILEALQSLITINITKITEETLNNIMIIFCRIFCFKNIETKNAIQLILGTFMKKIFDYCDNETIFNLLKNLELLSENLKKDWINSPSISSKCLGLELITTIIETFPDKLKNDIFKPVLNEDIKILLQKIFAMNSDHPIIGIKACRLALAIINNLNISYDLVEGLLKFVGKSSQVSWQKVIGLEFLSELFKNHKFLYGLYKMNKSLYEKILISFTDITYQSIMLKSKNSGNVGEQNTIGVGVNIPLLRKQSDSLYKMPNKKYLTNNLIINDENIIITQNINYIYKLIIECFVNLKNSYVILLEENNINVNVNTLDKIKKEQKSSKTLNTIMNDTQMELQEMISTQFVNIKGGLICIFININDITTSQTFISIMQTFIYIFSSFDLVSSRDELLDDLCKLAIPINLDNIFEVKEKNIIIIRAIFNLILCINLLDYSSWIILIETIQNLYFILIKSSAYLYNYKEQFNINIILNNLVNNIKKYSYSTDLSEIEKMILENENNQTNNTQSVLPELNISNKEHKLKLKSSVIGGTTNKNNKETLTEEHKENIEILSDVVNKLFIESNGYDDDSLITIIKALYDNTKRIFDDYIKEKKETKKIIKDNNSGVNNEANANKDNKKIISISSSSEIQKRGSTNINSNVNINSITNKDFQPQITTTNNTNYRFMQLNGVLSAAQTKIMNNLNYVLGNFTNNTNTSSISNIPTNVNNTITNNNASLQNEKLLANLTYINFNLVKLLSLTIINIKRIHLFWNVIIDIVNLLSSNSMNNRFSNTLSKFTIEILIQIIISIINQYKCNESKHYKQFGKKEIQITIFKPIFTFLNRHHNISFVLEPLQKILEKCSIKLNTLGWNSFINILNQILSNGKVDSQQCESVFKIVEQIFNEYSIYLNIFNIEHILNILEIFSVSKDNNNICYTSISYFWQCANICEDYQKEKKVITDEELELLSDDIKFSTKIEKDEYFGNLWKNIFFKLININNDERFDIKKSGINVFSQFYVAKIKSMNILYDKDKNRKISAEIIYELFFEIVNKNFKNYINNFKNKNSQEFKELEDIVVLTLQGIGKVIKCFIEENKNDKNKEEVFNENNKIFLTYINKCMDLMKSNTPLISINILKNLLDIESIDEKLFIENLNSNWKIINEIGNFIIDDNLFLKNYSKTVDGEKLVEVLVDTLKTIYSKLLSLEIEEEISDKEIEKLIIYLPKIFLSLSYTEFNFIKANPKVLINTEKILFELIEELGKKVKGVTLILSIKYLISFISFDLKNPHSEILCKRSIESIGKIFSNKNIHLIPNEEMSKIILSAINMIVPIIKQRTNNEILSYMIKNKKEDNKYMWNYIIDNLLYNILEPILFDLKDFIIFDKLIILFNELLNENQNIYQNTNKNYNDEMNKICQEIETSIIDFIINNLFQKSFFMDEKFKNKILSLFEIEPSEQNNIKNQICSSFPIHKLTLNSLFRICKFKKKEEINKDLEKIFIYNNYKKTNGNFEIDKIVEKYNEVKINIAKKSMPLLLQKCKEELKNYLKNIKNNNENEQKNERIKFILNNLKDMDYIFNEEDEKKYNNLIMKDCLKSKKGHLFMLHLIFGEFITVQNKEIINIIQDIFKVISQEIGLEENN